MFLIFGVKTFPYRIVPCSKRSREHLYKISRTIRIRKMGHVSQVLKFMSILGLCLLSRGTGIYSTVLHLYNVLIVGAYIVLNSCINVPNICISALLLLF